MRPAEFAGDVSPDGMQRLLNFSPWDEDAARDALARYVVRRMGDPAAVLVPDETGFLKKGRMSAGAARQCTGTAGRAENCQVGAFLAYATPDGGRALVDRKLYLPESWTGDRDHCHRLPYEPLPALGRGALHPFRGRVIRHRDLRAQAGCLVPRLGVTGAEQAGEAAGDLPARRVNGAQFGAGQ